jgi:hypothetical protein
MRRYLEVLIKKLKAVFAALFLSTLLIIAGCASTYEYPATGTNRTPASGEIDKDKIHKKKEDSDDMERLD